MTIVEKQQLFSRLLARFIPDLNKLGFEVTMGEVWRSAACAHLMADQKKGIVNSLHIMRMAMDLNIWRGASLIKGIEYSTAGELWESYSVVGSWECAWGGRFATKDYNHFSIENSGVR